LEIFILLICILFSSPGFKSPNTRQIFSKNLIFEPPTCTVIKVKIRVMELKKFLGSNFQSI
jgi:hypothetical protein